MSSSSMGGGEVEIGKYSGRVPGGVKGLAAAAATKTTTITKEFLVGVKGYTSCLHLDYMGCDVEIGKYSGRVPRGDRA